MLKIKPLHLAILAALAAIFIIHALSLSFTQDDAFISYRYVKNFLRGDGLVFNPGERVEGYTNFFFIILMILFGLPGLDYITVSKIIGIASGTGILLISYLWLKRVFGDKDRQIILFTAPTLLAANSAFCYWAISGLETVFFAFLIFWGLYLASERLILFVPVLALATLTRPEGGLILALVIIFYLFTRTCRLKTILQLVLIFALMLLPQLIFRLYYYNDFLPNPFYAKTGWSAEYFTSGLEYLWLFLKHYGFYGILILVPLAGFRIIPPQLKFLLYTAIIYTLYVLLVGGDVLHGHRFFVVLLPVFYVSFFGGIDCLWRKFTDYRPALNRVILFFILIAASVATFTIPGKWIRQIRSFEMGLIEVMKYHSSIIRKAEGNRLSVACSTIGALSYYSDAIVIDMLGLTDRTIAKEPRPVRGIKSTWKERNYNIPYLMGRNPDLILFSTGLKPSAPAEKALFLSSKFRKGYYPVFHVDRFMWTTFKRKPDFGGDDRYFSDPNFINLYADALNYFRDKKFELAFESARQAKKYGPPDFYPPLVEMGNVQLEWGNVKKGIAYLHQAFELSEGYATTAGDKLGRYYQLIGDSARAEEYFKIIQRNNRLD